MIGTSRFGQSRQADLSAVTAAIRESGTNLPGAACAGPLAWLWDDQLDAESKGGETRTSRAVRHAKAQAVCRLQCPASAQCLADRIHGDDLRGGVHGGEVFAEGERQPQAATAQCKQCHGGMDELRRQRRTHYCSDDCERLAERDRKRVSRAAGRAA